jgi:hypothetical protein
MRVLTSTAAAMTVAMLIVIGIVVVENHDSGNLTQYESEALDVVYMQNEITDRWNDTVEWFNQSHVTSDDEHIALYSKSVIAARSLAADSQAVIDRWQKIEVPEENVASHQLALEALMAHQDGLILFETFFQNALDTLVADQIQMLEAEAKLTRSMELWKQAEQAALAEG